LATVLALLLASALPSQASDWLARPLVGLVLAVNDDGTLNVRVAEETIEMVHVSGRSLVSMGPSDKLIGTKRYRLAGTEFSPPLNASRVQALRDWLVNMEVQLKVGQSFSADDAPEPVPAVVFKRNTNVQLNEELVRRGFGQVRVDEPDAIGSNEWSKILAAAQRK
jgi:hypothetical protein